MKFSFSYKFCMHLLCANLKSKLGFYLLGLHVSAATPVVEGSPELRPGMIYPTFSWLDCMFVDQKLGRVFMDARSWLCIK